MQAEGSEEERGVCVDRQAALSPGERTSGTEAPAATLPLNIYTQCMIVLSKQERLAQAWL